MEPGDRFESTLRSPEWRLRIFAGALLLVAISFAQRAGRIVGDTKTDLVLDPGKFLARALQLWDPNGAWGQVQNQAYGYLWPMGPFFWLGDAVGLPEWVIQRLWWGLLLVTAYLGMIVLLNALKIGKPWAQMLGGFAFALSPRMLSVMGPTSIEVWPLALAPWVLAPLVLATTTKRNPKKMAALSAIAVAMVGGVNAAATFAVIPLGAIWILLAPRGPRKNSLFIWWPIFVLMGTLWWLIPLFLLGSVSPPFLDFIESASTTTFAANITDALRGTTAWVPYIDWSSRAGRAFISDPIVILNSFVVLALGLIGLTRTPKRLHSFLAVGLIVGLLLITLGNEYSIFSAEIRSLLDGPLAPLRNTHKFDPIIRVVLVIGLVALVSNLPKQKDVRFSLERGVSAIAVASIIGASSPAWTGLLPTLGTYKEVPQYWQEAADWLNERPGDGNVLLLPGSSFAEHLWGNTRDEVFQSLLDRPWSVRNAIPLTPAGTIRTLDAVERAFATGAGSLELEQVLANNGIRYLVVRNDLEPRQPIVSSTVVNSTISSMPNTKLVADFGPKVGLPASFIDTDGRRLFVDFGAQTNHEAVQVFEIPSANWKAKSSVETLPVVVGDSSALLEPEFANLPAAILAGDVDESSPISGEIIVTDSHQKREAAFGRVITNRSASMSLSDPFSQDRRVHDFTIDSSSLAVRKLVGARAIRASSSMSQASAPNIRTDANPWSAFDNDWSTVWRANPAKFAKNAWVEIEFDTPTSLTGSTIILEGSQPDRKLKITVDDVTTELKAPAGVQISLGIDGVVGKRLRVTGPTSGFFPLAIRSINIPGAKVSRPLVLPAVSKDWGEVSAISLKADVPAADCWMVEKALRCSSLRSDFGEDYRLLDRIVNLPSAVSLPIRQLAQPLPAAALEEMASGDLEITASSRLVRSISVGPLAAIDGDQSSGWIANPSDTAPALRFKFKNPTEVRSLDLATDIYLPASYPKSATITFSDGSSEKVLFDRWGRTTFAPRETTLMAIRITSVYARDSFSPGEKEIEMPVGVSEISVNGRPLSAGAPRESIFGCGMGPTLEINGQSIESKITTSIAELVNGEHLETELCGSTSADLSSGENGIKAIASGMFRSTKVDFGSINPGFVKKAEVVREGSNLELITSQQNPQLFFVSQNANTGWASRSDPQVVNGWMQGWAISDKVQADYEIQRIYLPSIIVGFVLAMALSAYAVSSKKDSALRLSNRKKQNRIWRALGTVAATLGIVLISGPISLIAFVVGSVAGYISHQLRFSVLLVSILAVASSYVIYPWGSDAGWAGDFEWVHMIASACVGAVLGFFLKGDQSFNRITGNSSTL